MSGEPSLPVASVPLSPRKRVFDSGHTVISNESSGMQTTNVSKPGSLNPGKGNGKSERVKAIEPLLEASSFRPVSEIRLKH
ncbi:hypothetical protein C7B65_24675 [Phormidesmis priestleyi ULC007]|uniref:Uncharacterized protein n=1 Tax=Phormidesmis priestleyi ULC007 TaxID=1920490 RepID=A0A2T1D4D0_9CYAN|nr:hypothetical protein C7B65_24675 [Phormidesmis priestleyi ULC007]